MELKKTMMAYSTVWNEKPSFRLLPIDNDCPFIEAIYDVDSKMLAVIGKNKKNIFKMIPKLNAYGEAMVHKAKGADGKPTQKYVEERVVLEIQQEYYLDGEDVKTFINTFVFNTEHPSLKSI